MSPETRPSEAEFARMRAMLFEESRISPVETLIQRSLQNRPPRPWTVRNAIQILMKDYGSVIDKKDMEKAKKVLTIEDEARAFVELSS
jgi:hypothetical protein